MSGSSGLGVGGAGRFAAARYRVRIRLHTFVFMLRPGPSRSRRGGSPADRLRWTVGASGRSSIACRNAAGQVPLSGPLVDLEWPRPREGKCVTPTQLRAFAAVVRLGSVKQAAADLEVTEAAVSLHVGQLRRELGDKLFVRTNSGLAFTPGGLRLASRAVEMLSLQDRTIVEVRQAGGGRRLLRVATSALFAEHAAPGMFELFADRANDLDVELSTHSPSQVESLLVTRTVDAAIGPLPAILDSAIARTHFLNYQLVVVAGHEHPMTKLQPGTAALREQTWLLGPSAADDTGAMPGMLRRINVPEEHVRIFQSHAAALEEA